MAFIEIDDNIINTDYIVRVIFYEQDYTFRHCCAIIMSDGQRIDIEDGELTAQFKDELRKIGTAVVAIEAPGYDEYDTE